MTQAIQTNSSRFNHYITEVPQKIADTENRKALLYKIAAIVSAVAFVAIVAVAISISLGLISIHPAFAIPLILATIPLQLAISAALNRSSACKSKALEFSERAKEFKLISQWTPEQVKNFFNVQGLSLDTLPKDQPLTFLLPAVAAFNQTYKKVEKLFQDANKNLYSKNKDKTLCLSERRIGWQMMQQVLPMVFEASLILQSIQKPELKVCLKDLGKIHQISSEEMLLLGINGEKDEYFVFNDKNRSEPTADFGRILNLIGHSGPSGLREFLFPSGKPKQEESEYQQEIVDA